MSMQLWHIRSRGGADFGVWCAPTPADALAIMHRCAGVACRVEDGDVAFDDEDQYRVAGRVGDWDIEAAGDETEGETA